LSQPQCFKLLRCFYCAFWIFDSILMVAI